jgi:hypothetical protein
MLIEHFELTKEIRNEYFKKLHLLIKILTELKCAFENKLHYFNDNILFRK